MHWRSGSRPQQPAHQQRHAQNQKGEGIPESRGEFPRIDAVVRLFATGPCELGFLRFRVAIAESQVASTLEVNRRHQQPQSGANGAIRRLTRGALALEKGGDPFRLEQHSHAQRLAGTREPAERHPAARELHASGRPNGLVVCSERKFVFGAIGAGVEVPEALADRAESAWPRGVAALRTERFEEGLCRVQLGQNRAAAGWDRGMVASEARTLGNACNSEPHPTEGCALPQWASLARPLAPAS